MAHNTPVLPSPSHARTLARLLVASVSLGCADEPDVAVCLADRRDLAFEEAGVHGVSAEELAAHAPAQAHGTLTAPDGSVTRLRVTVAIDEDSAHEWVSTDGMSCRDSVAVNAKVHLRSDGGEIDAVLDTTLSASPNHTAEAVDAPSFSSSLPADAVQGSLDPEAYVDPTGFQDGAFDLTVSGHFVDGSLSGSIDLWAIRPINETDAETVDLVLAELQAEPADGWH